MERYEEEGEDSDNETDPEQLLNEWLGELDSLTAVSLTSPLSITTDCVSIHTQLLTKIYRSCNINLA